MLLGRASRIGLSQADIREHQARYEASQSANAKLGALRMSSAPSHATYASITSAQNNIGRARADSCSSRATVCGDNDDTQQHVLIRSPNTSRSHATSKGLIENPLFDPGAPVFVPRARFSSSNSTIESHIGRYPPFVRPALPQRSSSRRAHEHQTRSHRDVRDQSSHRSSPNLLVRPSHPTIHGPGIRTRSSSLSWQGHHHNDRRAPSMICVSSGVSNMPSTTIQPNRLARDSPLDELSQQLSRMATDAYRPRSTEESSERAAGRPSASLLSGDPFQVGGEPEVTSATSDSDGYRIILPPQADTAHRHDDRRDSLTDVHCLYELSLALPSPQIQHSPVLDDLRPPTSPMRSSPMPETTPRAASHVTVYDDSLSATLQPQTPADLARSITRRPYHYPSGTSRIDEMRVDGPVVSVPRRARNRQAYPSHAPAPRTPRDGITLRSMVDTPVRHTSLVEPASPPHPLQRFSPLQQTIVPPQERLSPRQHYTATVSHSNVRHSHHSIKSGASENSVELALETIEEDRRTRIARGGDRDLDVTPPAEGRYERYLS